MEPLLVSFGSLGARAADNLLVSALNSASLTSCTQIHRLRHANPLAGMPQFETGRTGRYIGTRVGTDGLVCEAVIPVS